MFLCGPLRVSGGFSDTYADKELLELSSTDTIQNIDEVSCRDYQRCSQQMSYLSAQLLSVAKVC